MSIDSLSKVPLADTHRPDLATGAPPSPSELDLAAPVHNLPRPPVKIFLGRKGELSSLEQALAAIGEAVITQAVYGLGGVGKSELALQYADTYRIKYRLIWWIAASEPTQIQSGLAALALRILSAIEATSSMQDAAQWALSWLQAHSGWLLILDDVNDLGDIESLLGQLTGGHIILTSRRDLDWWRIASPIRLDVLDSIDAVQVITLRTGRSAEMDTKAAVKIAAELGYLPLALDQAAAYITHQHITPSEYLNRLSLQPTHMVSCLLRSAGLSRR